MERDTFDRLARLVGTAGTRRAALRFALGVALLGGTATLEGADAKRGRNGNGDRNRSRKRNRDRGSVRAQQVSQVPSICLVNGGTGCGRPEGNCDGKRFGPGVDLSNCNFVNEDQFNVNLRGANLSGTCWLADNFFNRPSFRGANLTNACFFESDLSFSDFRATNLSGASFCEANLDGVDFRGSNVTAEQLACAGFVGCATILPNGKPAVPCGAGQTCCGGVCCAAADCQDGTCNG